MKARYCRSDHGAAVGVKRADGDRSPVAGEARPEPRGWCLCLLIERILGLQDSVVVAGMSMCRADVGDGTVTVFVVVPMDE